MAEARLTVSGPGGPREVVLQSKGFTIGRHPACDLILESDEVSRHHARIFQDPFERWIIEDLDSRNGVWIGAQRIKAKAILPGDQIQIGPFFLSLAETLDRQIEPDPSVTMTVLTREHADQGEMRFGRKTGGQVLSQSHVRQLNRITDRLAELNSAATLYSEVCCLLAESPMSVALVLRLPPPAVPLPDSPQIVACQFGRSGEGLSATGLENMHLSRRVLEAVRSSQNSVMATSHRTAEAQLQLTIIDTTGPRSVFCSPVSETTSVMDVLYLDLPGDHASDETFDFVQAVARHVDLTRRSLLLSERNAERRVLEHQLALARKIQSSLVPTDIAEVSGVDIAICYQPAMWVGGDYLDIWSLSDGRLAFAIGDVMGKGLPGALVMTNLQAALRTTTEFCTVPDEVIQHVDRHLRRHLESQMFVTMVLGIFDPSSGELEYVNAGHLLPLIIKDPHSVSPLGEPRNPPLGVAEVKFKKDRQTLAPGWGLLAVTDGITEARSPQNDQFGEARVEQVLTGTRFLSARQIVHAVASAAADFRKPHPQQDDVTLLAILNRSTEQTTVA